MVPPPAIRRFRPGNHCAACRRHSKPFREWVTTPMARSGGECRRPGGRATRGRGAGPRCGRRGSCRHPAGRPGPRAGRRPGLPAGGGAQPVPDTAWRVRAVPPEVHDGIGGCPGDGMACAGSPVQRSLDGASVSARPQPVINAERGLHDEVREVTNRSRDRLAGGPVRGSQPDPVPRWRLPFNHGDSAAMVAMADGERRGARASASAADTARQGERAGPRRRAQR